MAFASAARVQAMKLLFSEVTPDYAHYIFPYAIWAVPEAGETPAQIFDAGFLPSSRFLDRFYLCRQIRVALNEFATSSENRRILRKCEGITCRVVPRAEFDYTPERREFYRDYAEKKFGTGVMSNERLDNLFSAPIVSHILEFRDGQRRVGDVLLYLEEPSLAYYYYSFYDLDYFARNLGIFMMTSAVALFAHRGFKHLHLGTCYSESALYKTQFRGAEFFNGFTWSQNMDELKFLLAKDKQSSPQHLLEMSDLEAFYPGGLKDFASRTPFRA
jgi:arginyl-tRNA--protein-N-Asp/Glu arginylyltransferase